MVTHTFVRTHRSRESGQATVPLLLLFVAGCLAVFGSWSVMRLHFRLAERQLSLDACVGRKAIHLRDLLRYIDASNDRITGLRASIAAASLQPELIPPFRSWLEAEVGAQELRLLAWQTEIAPWRAGAACLPGSPALASTVPDLSLRRSPPDSIGSNRLEWIGPEPVRLSFSVTGLRRSAGAEVRRHPQPIPAEEKWTAHWIPTTPANPFWRP